MRLTVLVAVVLLVACVGVTGVRNVHRGPDGRFTGEIGYMLLGNQAMRDYSKGEAESRANGICGHGFDVEREWGNSEFGVTADDGIRNFKFRCRLPDAGAQVP